MLDIKSAALALLAATLASAIPVAQTSPPANVNQTFTLEYIIRDPSSTSPPPLPQNPSSAVSLYEPTKGIPLAKLRLLAPTNSSSTKFTLRGGYLHVSADEVPVPGASATQAAIGWNSNNTIGFTPGGGAIEFKNANFGADGDMHLDLTTRAIDLGSDYTRFFLCTGGKWNGNKDQQYLSFGADPASTNQCKPLFLYGRPT